MRKWYAAAAVVIVMLIWSFGPRPEMGKPDVAVARASVPADPGDLDAFLSRSEGQFSDITPETEKVIRWQGEPGQVTPIALVYLHGFSATRQEIEPVVSVLADRLGANVYFARLRGHGRPGKAMGAATAAEWLEDTAEALEIGRRIGEQVVVMGVSTGATLGAVHLLDHPSDDIMGFVAISPNFGPVDPRAELFVGPWLPFILPTILGNRRWEAKNEEQELYWTTEYPMTALVQMMLLVDHARSRDWSTWDAPLVVIRNDEDTVVDAAATDRWLVSVKRGLLVALPPQPGDDDHVLAGRIVSPRGTEHMVGLLGQTIEGW